MKKIVLTILFLSISMINHAQKADAIVGKWVFTKALNKNINKASLDYMKTEVIGKWKFHFMADGKFTTTMMAEKASGEWQILSGSNMLILSGIEDGPLKFEILNSSENELALKVGLGEFLLTRIKE